MPFKKLVVKEVLEEGCEILHAREIEVATLVSLGLRNREIADRLHVSERTVQAHLFHIFRKCQVKSRSAMILRLIKAGIIKPEDIDMSPE
jgi:DNA-binding NarL/FixJ family response regulator